MKTLGSFFSVFVLLLSVHVSAYAQSPRLNITAEAKGTPFTLTVHTRQDTLTYDEQTPCSHDVPPEALKMIIKQPQSERLTLKALNGGVTLVHESNHPTRIDVDGRNLAFSSLAPKEPESEEQ